jgi:hypothetical protein
MNAKQEAAMYILFNTLLASTASQETRCEDPNQERKNAIFQQLEEEHLQKKAALKAEYEAAGFEYATF